MLAGKNRESVVKVSSELLLEVERFISMGRNRIKYSSKKQFIDIAVMELLNKESKGGRS